MGTQTAAAETDFNLLQFEKRLTSLKDSQECINTCCQWCLQNRQHHKKIVNAWLNVLKRVKVEQRLILFYLANDVVQYSKKRSYEFVDSWGTAIQKATTLVRDDKVKHKILRIFKIWEQRGVYNEEFISDLCGLINVVPSAPKGDEPHEFQTNYVIQKIKTCTKLESDTDTKLKMLKEHNPKIQITPELYASLKDRAHVDDVEKEVEVYTKHMEDYINALKLEIKTRINLITVLKQAEGQLEADRKDVKLVAHAYRTFGTRVRTFQKKLDLHTATLSSPIPSPDIDAPSPSPDSDIDLPDEDSIPDNDTKTDFNTPIQFTNPGYYNPVPPPTTEASDGGFLSNGFSSFLGSNVPFDMQNLNSVFSAALGNNSVTTASSVPPPAYVPPVQPPLPVEAPVQQQDAGFYAPTTTPHVPLLPPPMPPFTSKSDRNFHNAPYNPATGVFNNNSNRTSFASNSYADTSFNSTTDTSFNSSSIYNPNDSNSFQQSYDSSNQYQNNSTQEEYNPEQELETWEADASWSNMTGKDMETPESPPIFEKESHVEPIEYHDNAHSGAVDVDHRVLPLLPAELDDSLSSLGGKDVDHRNLISLTGSPALDNNSNSQSDIWSQSDKDYRSKSSSDQDYRLPFNIPNLKLPPPPPPPSGNHLDPSLIKEKNLQSKSPKKFQDNVECTDMDMSDDETDYKMSDNSKASLEDRFSLEPPPPLPDLPDDVDANNFLDDLSNDLNEFGNLANEDNSSSNNIWENGPPPGMGVPPPPRMPFKMDMGSPMMPGMLNMPPPNNNWNDEPQNNWGHEEDMNQSWSGPDNWQNNSPNFQNFRGGRGMMRGSPYPRGRGRGMFNNNFRGNGNFRGRSPRGRPPMMNHRPRGNFRGNFRGAF